MTSTWQRIIKAGKGILEIAREQRLSGLKHITEHIEVGRSGDSEWVDYYTSEYENSVTLWFNKKECERIEARPPALDVLEEIAQAFEEALEIWRKM